MADLGSVRNRDRCLTALCRPSISFSAAVYGFAVVLFLGSRGFTTSGPPLRIPGVLVAVLLHADFSVGWESGRDRHQPFPKPCRVTVVPTFPVRLPPALSRKPSVPLPMPNIFTLRGPAATEVLAAL